MLMFKCFYAHKQVLRLFCNNFVTYESKDSLYKRENLASIAIKQIQCLYWLPKTILGHLFAPYSLFCSL